MIGAALFYPTYPTIPHIWTSAVWRAGQGRGLNEQLPFDARAPK